MRNNNMFKLRNKEKYLFGHFLSGAMKLNAKHQNPKSCHGQ